MSPIHTPKKQIGLLIYLFLSISCHTYQAATCNEPAHPTASLTKWKRNILIGSVAFISSSTAAYLLYKYKRSNIKKEINKKKEQIPPSGENSKTLVEKTEYKRLFLAEKFIPIKLIKKTYHKLYLTEKLIPIELIKKEKDGNIVSVDSWSISRIQIRLQPYFNQVRLQPNLKTKIVSLIAGYVNLTGCTYQFILTYEPLLGGTPLDEAYKGKYKKYIPSLLQKANVDNIDVFSVGVLRDIKIKEKKYPFLSLSNVVVCQESHSELYAACYIIPNLGELQANEYCSMTLSSYNSTEETYCFCTFDKPYYDMHYCEYQYKFDSIKKVYRYFFTKKTVYYLDIENKKWETTFCVRGYDLDIKIFLRVKKP